MAQKQLNIRIDEELHKKAKIAAILRGETLNSFIEQAITTFLDKNTTSPGARTIDKIPIKASVKPTKSSRKNKRKKENKNRIQNIPNLKHSQKRKN